MLTPVIYFQLGERKRISRILEADYRL